MYGDGGRPTSREVEERLRSLIPTLRRLATSLGGRADEVDEFVQETICRALEHSIPVGELAAWCPVVLGHVRNDALRRRARQQSAVQRLPRQLVSPDHADDVADRDAARALRAHLERLPPAQARFLRGLVEGESIESLAARAGVSRKAVEMQLWRARVSLRAAYKAGAERSYVVRDVF